MSPALQADSLPSEPQGKPENRHIIVNFFKCDNVSIIYENSFSFGEALKALGVMCYGICS